MEVFLVYEEIIYSILSHLTLMSRNLNHFFISGILRKTLKFRSGIKILHLKYCMISNIIVFSMSNSLTVKFILIHGL